MIVTAAHRRVAFAAGWIAVLGLQLGLLSYFNGEMLWSDQPYAGLDFDTHIEQTWRVLEGLEQVQRTWVYDVHLLAGMPNGVIFNADNKGWELFTWGGTLLGLSRGFSFNLFALLCHLSIVPILYTGARLFRVKPWAALLAAAFATLFWNFDSWSHWCWYVGMIAYSFGSFFFVLPLGFFYRWTTERRPGWLVGVAVTLALAHLIHPYSFFVLVVPMLVLYGRVFRSLSWKEQLGVFAAVGLTLAVNGYWLHNAAMFWHYIVDSSLFAETGIDTALWDLLGLMTEPAATGIIGKRTAFRSVLILGGFFATVAWWKRGDDRLAPLGSALLFLVVVAYFGTYTVLAHTQPYRNLMPAGFLSAIMFAALIQHAVDAGLFRRLSNGARAMVGFLLFPASLYLVGDAIYYFADSAPTPAPLPHGESSGLSAFGFPRHPSYRYANWHLEPLADWVRERDDGSGRFLVEGWSWGEQLAWKTDAQIMGGFIWRNLDHSWSNFFRRRPQGIARPGDLRAYLRTYAVKWIIIHTPRAQAPWWDKFPSLELVEEVGGLRFYRVREPAGFIVKGKGDVKASTNRIEVRGTNPNEPVVLRYHWMETLACTPNCTIERRETRGDAVGFMRIPAPHPADFLIYNTYRFDPGDM